MCFSLLFSCYLEPDITHNDCRTPDTKNSLLLKMHFFTRISFWSQSYHYNSLLHFSSLFLEEMNTIFTWDTGISFPWLPFLYPKTVPCWVYSVFFIWSSLMYKKHFHLYMYILCRILNRILWLCSWLIYLFIYFLNCYSELRPRTLLDLLSAGLLQWTLDESCELHLEAVSHPSKSLVEGHY